MIPKRFLVLVYTVTFIFEVLVLEIGNGEKSGVDDQGLTVKVEVEDVERVILEAEAGEGRKLLNLVVLLRDVFLFRKKLRRENRKI